MGAQREGKIGEQRRGYWLGSQLFRLPWTCSAPEVAIGMLDSVRALLGLVGCHGHAGLIRCERVSGSSEREQEQEQEQEQE